MSTTRKIPQPDDKQYNLFTGVPVNAEAVRKKTAVDSGRCFVTGDALSIFIGTTRLKDHLERCGGEEVFTVARLLDEQDWRPFEQRYAVTGRAPYAPRLMLGLILYGVMQGVNSLRGLERLARLDLGCMWVTGGIAPDHANIGRFIVLHEESLSEDFFVSLTQSVLKACGSKSQRLAGDGTVIEAACSHYNLLKKEAVRARALAASEEVARTPDDEAAKQKQRDTQQCQEIFEEREANRRRRGKKDSALCISGKEPEAMVQKLKRGRGFGPSYKPSVLANEDRIITAFAVDASSETGVVGSLLDQSEQVTGSMAEELLVDSGYFHDEVIAATLEREVSLLCPESPDMEKENVPEKGLFHKREFHYDEFTDTYQCPAGQKLFLLHRCAQTEKTRGYDLYATPGCQGCLLRDKCTQGGQGRRIKRYPEDEQRTALRFVMAQPAAKSIFRQRQAMVEPVFSALRCQQQFNRFRRKGLQAVKREFALHALAYNLSRAVALLRLLFGLLYVALRGSEKVRLYFFTLSRQLEGVCRQLLLPFIFRWRDG